MRLYAVDVPFTDDAHSILNTAIFKMEQNEDDSVSFIDPDTKNTIHKTAPVIKKIDDGAGYGRITLKTSDGTVYKIGHVKEVLPAPVALALLMKYGM